MLPFTEADVRRYFGDRTFAKGRDYQRGRRVLSAFLSDDGSAVDGSVRGSERVPYGVTVHLDGLGTRRGPTFEGDCTCFLGGYCKHMAAVLLELLARDAAVPAAAPGVDPALGRWLASLEPTEPAPGVGAARAVLYRLDLAPDARTVAVEVLSASLRKDGSPGAGTKPMGSSTLTSVVSGYGAPQYVDAADTEILRFLWATRSGRAGHVGHVGHVGAGFALQGAFAASVLDAIVTTGRAHWRTPHGPALRRGPPRRAEGRWDPAADGTQSFAFAVDGEAVVLPLAPPWYVAADGTCGPLATGLDDRAAHLLATAPTVSAEAAARVRAALATRLPDRADLLPSTFEETVRRAVRPRPMLHLWIQAWDDALDAFDLDDEPIEAVHGRLSFDYDGQTVDAGDPRGELRRTEAGRFVVIPRRPDLEAAAAERLAGLGFLETADGGVLVLAPDDDADAAVGDPGQELLAFLHRTAPSLTAEGWTVAFLDGTLPDFAEPEGWTAEVEEPSGVDWFGLSLGVVVDGQRIDLLPMLLPVLRTLPDGIAPESIGGREPDATLFLPMPDGRILPMPAGRLGTVVRTLYELYRVGAIDDDGQIRLSAAQSAELAEIEAATAAAGLRWMGGERLRQIGAKLRDFAGIAPVPPPAGLAASLRPYQSAGLSWMQFLREYGLGGVLADDMGLGKTVQALAHALTEKEAGRLDRPCLVVAPTSLMANWKAEAARFAPGLRTLVLHGAGRKAGHERLDEHDLVLTTYPLLPRDRDVLLAQEWHLLILDEAQAIKNPQAQLSRVAVQLRARHRLCLTGTPLENNLAELWSLFHFLMPGLLGDQRGFQTTFRTPIEKKGDAVRGRLLARRVRPFLLRRTKEQVAADLPPKTEIVEWVELEGAQRDLYETIRLAMDAKVRAEVSKKGLARSHIVILEALLKLRQVCCDPRLVKLSGAGKARTSAKLARLLEMVPEMAAEGRRILLFSQFTSMLDLIAPELERLRIPFVTLTGQTRNREAPITRFQAGEVPLFLISPKAGGTGLNLTAADTVIHYDPWWNPAVERQATDRAHRIGQDKPVFVHKLVSVGTVEEAILDLQARKQALADALFDPDARDAAALTPDDLEALFRPIAM
ncbi:SNF2-related protein [Azospirillum sp. ST 5-10]|uniref:DEAD/DEAH box helicase n=1 Tax=unclassified Azospirillum TaxID=2630922 RepID=UPI003F4A114B